MSFLSGAVYAQDVVVGVNVVNPRRASIADQNAVFDQLQAAHVQVIRCGISNDDFLCASALFLMSAPACAQQVVVGVNTVAARRFFGTRTRSMWSDASAPRTSSGEDDDSSVQLA
jgi:hypothetical protein